MLTNFNLVKQLNLLPKKGRILVSPLNWGIGHATRCIPIIKQLKKNGFTPILASDGDALNLLQKVFPDVICYNLPSYEVKYAKNSRFFTLKLLSQLPQFFKTYKQEQKRIRELVKKENIDTIISDNRFGVFHKGITSIYITHQLKVKSGLFTFLTTKFHQKIIKKFDQCWLPDVEKSPNLSAALSHVDSFPIPSTYIGILSSLEKQKIPIKYDILVLLSGPEPQRSQLEKKLLDELKNTSKNICFIRGVIENQIEKKQENTLTIYNYLLSDDLQKVINESELVLARSGYSILMDLSKLEKKAFFIPTPGQSEQLYLAAHLEKQKIAPFSLQKDFQLKLLEKVVNYKGFL